MRLRQVVAEAFGPFNHQTLDLAPGVTVVWGPNESGKSTWHAAAYAALCGLRRGKGKPRKAEQAFADRHRPWDDAGWRVAATAELADGRVVEFRQDLGGKTDCRVRELELGRDLSDELMHDGSPDGAMLFGLTRDTLLPTIWVRQADVLRVLADSDALQETLQRAAATGGADDTAQRALERLSAFHRDHVGVDRRNSTKPLRHAIDAAQHARDQLETARAAHAEYCELARRRDEARRAAEEAVARRDRARAAVARRDLRQAQQHLAEVEELAGRFPHGPPRDPDVDTACADQVASALAAWRARPEEPVPAAGPSAAELEDQLNALPPVPEGDTEVAPAVAAASTAWGQAAARLAAVEDSDVPPADAACDVGDLAERATPGELRELAEGLETAVPEVDPDLERRATTATPGPLPRRPLLLAAAVALLAGTGLIVTGTVTVGGVLLAGGAVCGALAMLARPGTGAAAQQARAQLAVQQATAQHARERRANAVAQTQRLGVEDDPARLRRLARAVEDRAYAAERQAARDAEVGRRRQECEEAAAALRQALAARGAPSGDDLDAAMADYRAACGQRAAQAREAQRAESLRAQLADRRQREEAAERDRHRRAEADRAVRAAAHEAGLDGADTDSDPASLVGRLEAWQRRQAEERRRLLAQWEEWNRLQALLGSATVDDVRAETERRREALAALADVDAVALPNGDAEALLEDYERRASEAEQHLAGVEGQLTNRADSIPSVAEAEEACARADAHLARLRRLDDTVRTTQSLLTQARDRVHRTIAPRLKHSVERWLPHVTGERYGEAAVDPATLEVRVRAAGGPWRDATNLSHGTAEQIYLLLRVAMAEHLVTTGEPAPLLLDDPTVQADADRTQALLGLLHELSRERQVVVFSQEPEVRQWAEEHLTPPDDALVTLDPAAIPA